MCGGSRCGSGAQLWKGQKTNYEFGSKIVNVRIKYNFSPVIFNHLNFKMPSKSQPKNGK
jgi:hypothetical protein